MNKIQGFLKVSLILIVLANMTNVRANEVIDNEVSIKGEELTEFDIVYMEEVEEEEIIEIEDVPSFGDCGIMLISNNETPSIIKETGTYTISAIIFMIICLCGAIICFISDED